MKRVNSYFATANTGDGFVSFLDKIVYENKTPFIYILKGGSGTGKSTLMKDISKYFENQNFDVENFYCSTDTQSLDGVFIPRKNIAIVDGTAPHIINANLTGVDSKIIDLGNAVKDSVAKNRKDLEKFVKQKTEYYRKMFEYLASAKHLQNIDSAKTDKRNENRYQKIAKELYIKIPQQKLSFHIPRKLFLQSFNYVHNDLEDENHFTKICFSACENESTIILRNLTNILDKKHIFYDLVMDNLNPKNINGIIVNNQILIKNCKNKLKINKNNKNLIKKLINLAINNLKKAKQVHNQIEKIYIANVDFDIVNKIGEELKKEIASR